MIDAEKGASRGAIERIRRSVTEADFKKICTEMGEDGTAEGEEENFEF